MKISRLGNTVFLAFLLAGTRLLLAEEDKTSDRCGVCHEQETNDWEASKHARRAGGLGATGYLGTAELYNLGSSPGMFELLLLE